MITGTIKNKIDKNGNIVEQDAEEAAEEEDATEAEWLYQ